MKNKEYFAIIFRMNQYTSKQSGFIKWVVIILIILIVLGYYGFDVREIIESQQVQENIHYVWGFVVHVWDTYLKGPALYLWNIWTDLIWSGFVENLQKLRGGQPDELQENAPSVFRYSYFV